MFNDVLSEALITEENRWEDFDVIEVPWMEDPITKTKPYKIPMKKLLSVQSQARSALNNITFAFFTNTLAKFETCYTFRVPTQATDGFTLYINPAFTWDMYMKMGKDGLLACAFVMAHECMHSILNHNIRVIKDIDQYTANVAADYEVNTTLCRLFPNIFTPELVEKLDGFYDKKYDTLPFEYIYKQIKGSVNKNSSSNQVQKQNQNNAKNSSSSRSSSQSSSSQSSNNDEEKSQDYKDGWAQAMEDYKSGKLKI